MNATFFIKGKPKGTPRPRACIRGKHAGVYSPGTNLEWRMAIADAVNTSGISAVFGRCPVGVDMEFFFDHPKSATKKKIREWSGPYAYKPDKDNLEKGVLDELTNCGVWKDDCIVADGRVMKTKLSDNLKSKGLVEGCLVRIYEI
jgi:Holliday junction resolvase RusA-like endonuclease